MEPDRRPPTIRPEDVRYADEMTRHTADDENAPDVIQIRHLNTHYPLRFKPYAISDGLVTIGDIRHFASIELGKVDPRRLKLLYKGKILKDDEKIAKAEGLKQLSEVLVVVSEGIVRDSSESGSDNERAQDAAARRKKSRRKSKAAPPQRDSTSPTLTGSAASASSLAGTTSPSQPPNSPRGKVEHLTNLYRTQWAPLCQDYISRPPSDAKTKDFEHKRLTESILAQIILKADDIEMEGDQIARQERKALLKETQEMLRRLDAVVGKKSS